MLVYFVGWKKKLLAGVVRLYFFNNFFSQSLYGFFVCVCSYANPALYFGCIKYWFFFSLHSECPFTQHTRYKYISWHLIQYLATLENSVLSKPLHGRQQLQISQSTRHLVTLSLLEEVLVLGEHQHRWQLKYPPFNFF